MTYLVNLGAFQATWLVTVFAAAEGRLWPGASVLACSVAAQSARRLNVRLPGLGLLAGTAAIGLCSDSALWRLGWISFPEHAQIGWPVPVWMSVLWVNFATTLDESLAWAGKRPLLAAALGSVGGPLSYLSGEYVGALTVGPRAGAVLALAGLWAMAIPLLAWIAKSLRGSGHAGAPSAVKGGPS